MNLLRKLAVFIVALGSMPVAQAGVIYNWYDLDPNPNIGAISGFIEIDHNYWTPGGSLQGYYEGVSAYFGIKQFDLGSESGPSVYGFSAQPCHDYCAGGSSPGELVFGDTNESVFGFNLHFGQFLTGWLYVNDTETEFDMFGTLIWTTALVSSDNFAGGCDVHPNDCAGGTGLWLLDLTTIPEPGTLALSGLGLAVMGMSRRKKNLTCSNQ